MRFAITFQSYRKDTVYNEQKMLKQNGAFH